MDPAGNVKASKERSTGRIDGISAMITAGALLIAEPPPPEPTGWLLEVVPRGDW